MKASELHQVTTDVLLSKELTKRVFDFIASQAKEGHFGTSVRLNDDILEVNKLEQLLKDFGYTTSVTTSYQGNDLHIRW